MILLLLLVVLRIQVLSISILVTTIPEAESRCGCHGIPGPGFFAQNRQQNHNFDALPQPGGGSGGIVFRIIVLYFPGYEEMYNPITHTSHTSIQK